MKLSCPVIRDGGSFVELWGTEYHFAPMPDGCHVAEVENPEHQDRFLEIGYRFIVAKMHKRKLHPKNVHQSKGNLLCCVQKLSKMLIQL